ncbi:MULTISPECIES: hypothetical protein [Bizionia]|uniref:Uncharacterized protein n=1 Tax=Bizionia algoritergicola TaxID=291187 RepID=A0A5D0R3C2_9FLAO|nr:MULTISPECIES: hypothetical protein [Bizionia]OBX23741.1 hypothetical protein BAA08_03555 [Bizionia sp. APA-3]TYB75465.1 hypothetical protein ES675_04900 [Bizionia algoritergicola]
MDKRSNRVQPIRLSPKFFPLDIHKSMFINDLMITIPQYYAESWGEQVLNTHNLDNKSWEIEINYESPKELGKVKNNFKGRLSLFFAKGRSKTSSYRLKWNNDFAIQLAKDYPKSFVRSLEFHIGDDYYKNQKFTEYDIGGFKEQLQVKIIWTDNNPKIYLKEFFRVREESQGFPKIFNELSSYLITDYLLSSEDEILRRIQVSDWKPRINIQKELNENNIYILLNRETKEVYFGETKKSLSKRYPIKQKHHSFDEWTEYCIIQLPPETSEHSRLLVERILIAVGSKLFPNILYSDKPVLDLGIGLTLKNRKK